MELALVYETRDAGSNPAGGALKEEGMRIDISKIECSKKGCEGFMVSKKSSQDSFSVRVKWNQDQERFHALKCEECNHELDLTIRAKLG